MLDSADIALLGSVGSILIASSLATRLRLRRDRMNIQKYGLFAVRDCFVYLVAQGKLKETDFLFLVFYKASNYFINETKQITLGRLVRTIEEGRKKNLDPGSQRLSKKVQRELSKVKDPEVHAAVRNFYQAMNEIIVDNSILLKTFIKPGLPKDCLRLLLKLFKSLRRDGKTTQERAYAYHRDYESRLAAAA